MIKTDVSDRNIGAGDIVCHFKKTLHPENPEVKYLYMVDTIAHHSETNENMVVYHSVENPSKVCVRPYDMFMSEVEKDKYPEATATYRFEKVIIPKIAATEIENAINDRAIKL